MRLFKDTSNGFEELLDMYPSFYRNVYEMIEILKAQGNVSDLLRLDIQQVFFNQFIDMADNTTLSDFEKILGIGTTGKTSDERRRIIKACLVSSGKLSASMIKDIISACTGAEATITFESESYNADYDTLTINADRGTNNIVDIADIMKIVSNKIPAHISYNMTWIYDFSAAVEMKLEIYNSDIPRCGLYKCGQNILF